MVNLISSELSNLLRTGFFSQFCSLSFLNQEKLYIKQQSLLPVVPKSPPCRVNEMIKPNKN